MVLQTIIGEGKGIKYIPLLEDADLLSTEFLGEPMYIYIKLYRIMHSVSNLTFYHIKFCRTTGE